ncbi:MAG: hypothetical protein R6X14_05445, partial [bacterium]
MLTLTLAVALAFSSVSAGRLDFVGYREEALRDTLSRVGPLMGHRWLEKNGFQDYLLRQTWRPVSDSGLRCVGRWSYGPSLKVSLRITPDDTIVCLTRGSGASLIRFGSRDGVTLDLLGDVDFAGRPRRAVIADTLVIAGIQFGASGLEIHGVSNPASPNLLSRVDLPMVNDIAVQDTLVYAACGDDSLRIFNIADPRRPVLAGALRDSCDLYMALAGEYCYLVHVSGVNIVDISDPTSPRRVGRIGGGEPLAVHARDSRAYVMMYGYGLRVYDISDPAAPRPLGSLEGPNVFGVTMAETCDTLLYTPMLDAISVADPTRPRLLGRASVPADMKYGIAVPPGSGHALVANYFDGIVAVDITSPAAPVLDTMAFAAGAAVDLDVSGTRAYLGSYTAGMSILDVADPSRPRRLGQLNNPGRGGHCLAVVVDDSFVYVCWDSVPLFRSVDVADPTRPRLVGGYDVFGFPQDMVLRDSFCYVAQNRRFQILNVARPREPTLVGTVVVGDANVPGMFLQDTLAFVTNWPTQVISVADPRNPRVIADFGRGALNIFIKDTFAYLAGGNGVFTYSIADPLSPYLVDSTGFGSYVFDVVVEDTLAYVGCRDALRLLSVADPREPRLVGYHSLPWYAQRLSYAEPYVYAACYEAGVAILEIVPTGVVEKGSESKIIEALQILPSPTRGRMAVRLSGEESSWAVRDVTGRMVDSGRISSAQKMLMLELDDRPAGV